jgi:hypothetical protein
LTPAGAFLEVEQPGRLVWRDRDIDLLVMITFVDLGGGAR